jgi:protein-tyrosine-phosphatase
MFEVLKKYCEDRIREFERITPQRKTQLEKISDYIKQHKNPQVVFVCTHNSRRSQLSQVWATVAAHYFKLVSTHFYSAGTESTAFHSNAVEALVRSGLRVEGVKNEENPDYFFHFGVDKSIKCYSKTIDHESLPKSNFAAIMTCGDAEENCPFLPGAELRVPITYQDPKISDGTSKVEEVYDERCAQIAREMLFLVQKAG